MNKWNPTSWLACICTAEGRLCRYVTLYIGYYLNASDCYTHELCVENQSGDQTERGIERDTCCKSEMEWTERARWNERKEQDGYWMNADDTDKTRVNSSSQQHEHVICIALTINFLVVAILVLQMCNIPIHLRIHFMCFHWFSHEHFEQIDCANTFMFTHNMCHRWH